MEDQKVTLAAAYLNEVADSWYQGWVQDGGLQGGWRAFSEGLCECFREKKMTNVIKEFSKLKQEGTVMEYLARFEELRSLVCMIQPGLAEQYVVSIFVSGLKEELRPMIKMMTPTTMGQAAEKVRLQELTLEAIFKKHKVPCKPSILVRQYRGGSSRPVTTWPNQSTAKLVVNSNGGKGSLMEQRR